MVNSNLNQAKKETKELNLPADKDANKDLNPADFLIDENFKIVKAHYGNHMDDNIDFNELKAFAGIGSQFKKTS